MPKTKEQTIQEEVEKRLLELLTVVDLSAVVKLDQHGLLYIGGERPSEERLLGLRSQAELIQQSEVWKLIYESPKQLAQEALFVTGNDLASLQKGRSMLYVLETQKKIIDTFAAYQPRK